MIFYLIKKKEKENTVSQAVTLQVICQCRTAVTWDLTDPLDLGLQGQCDFPDLIVLGVIYLEPSGQFMAAMSRLMCQCH